MRTDTEIKHLILEIANQDIRIRAVLLNGSKANPSVKSDRRIRSTNTIGHSQYPFPPYWQIGGGKGLFSVNLSG